MIISCAWRRGWMIVTCVSGCAGSVWGYSASVVAVIVSIAPGAPNFVVPFSSAVSCVVTSSSASLAFLRSPASIPICGCA